MDLSQRLDEMELAIHKPSFRKGTGRANEVNYWVFDYPPEKELEVRERVEYLKNKNDRGDDDFELVVFDLYDIIIDFLEKKNFMEKCYDFEKKRGIERIVKAVTNSMKVNDDDSLIVQYIKEHTPENAVVFLTGIGKCYPILRSHKVLNNLHQAFVRCPVVMFFPGTYNEQELILFNEIKDDMASGSFARGKEEKAASASMVFVGNINQSVDVLLKTSSLFDPFPPEMGTDTAFLDRLHCYIPGWEIPKFRPEHFTNDYGFITDYLAEFIRELRKEQYGDALDKYFRLGKNLNQRDTIAVRKIVGGYVKLLYPDGEFTKEQIEEILVFALEMRRRVKEQLKKLGGMEFYDVNFSYIDLDTFEEKFVSVPEQGGGKLIPDGICNPGQVYTVSQGKSGMIGVFRLESQMLPGNGKFERTGLGSDRDCKESTNTAFNFLKANGNRISGSISTTMRDYIINYQDLQGIGMTGKLALPTLIALCSIALGRPTVSTLAVLGEISISGTILKVDELANSLQVCLDSGAKKVLLPITSAADLGTVPPELVGSFNLIFYSSAEDAVFKALGVE